MAEYNKESPLSPLFSVYPLKCWYNFFFYSTEYVEAGLRDFMNARGMSRDYFYFVLGFRWSVDINYFCFWMLMLMQSWQYVVVDVVCSAHHTPRLTSTAGLSTSLLSIFIPLLLSPFPSLILSPHLLAVFHLLLFFFSELSFYMLPSSFTSLSLSFLLPHVPL